MGYIGQTLWDTLGKNFGIYWAKTMGYIEQKLWDILGKSNGIYWPKNGIHRAKYGIY